MKSSAKVRGIFAAFGMLLLILDSKTAFRGAAEGISLCIRTVIPSLFPFFVLSLILTSALLGTSVRVLRPIGKFCGIPSGTEAILLVGFLGGYPVGAQCIANAYHSGRIKKGDASKMLAFCNNAGPAFLFGMASALFPRIEYAWLLWGIHIASALLISRLFPCGAAQVNPLRAHDVLSFSDALSRAIKIMSGVCGWVVLFRMVLSFFDRWFSFFFPRSLWTFLSGLCELSNGCCALSDIGSVPLRFVLCSVMLAFGGLCVAMQTVNVTPGISKRYYFPGKLGQAFLSFLFSAAFAYRGIYPFVAAVFAIILIFLPKMRINSRFPVHVRV